MAAARARGQREEESAPKQTDRQTDTRVRLHDGGACFALLHACGSRAYPFHSTLPGTARSRSRWPAASTPPGVCMLGAAAALRPPHPQSCRRSPSSASALHPPHPHSLRCPPASRPRPPLLPPPLPRPPAAAPPPTTRAPHRVRPPPPPPPGPCPVLRSGGHRLRHLDQGP